MGEQIAAQHVETSILKGKRQRVANHCPVSVV